MKSRIAAILICSGLVTDVYAQTGNSPVERVPDQFRTKYEVSIGGILNKMQSDDPNYERFLGKKYGVIVQLGLSQYLADRFDLNFSISYSNKGYKRSSVRLDTTLQVREIMKVQVQTLNYISSLLLLKCFIDKAHRFGLSIGPYFGILVSDKLYDREYINGVLGYTQSYHNVGYERLDFGLSTELSWQVGSLAGKNLVLKLRWDRGLHNIGPGSGAMYNQIFAFQGGIVL